MELNIKIRKSVLKDKFEILDIINCAKKRLLEINCPQWNQDDGYPDINTILDDIKKEQSYVCLINQKVAGTFVLSNENEFSYDEIDGSWLTNLTKYLVIHRFAVKKEYLRLGVASKIIKDIINSSSSDYKSIRIDTHPLNSSMNSFLTKLGFIKCGIIRLKRSNIDNVRYAFEYVINQKSNKL